MQLYFESDLKLDRVGIRSNIDKKVQDTAVFLERIKREDEGEK